MLYTTIEQDTPILPWVIAETVVAEVERYIYAEHGQELLEGQASAAAEYLAKFADTVYFHNPRFRKDVRAKGNRWRDHLYMFMRHWLYAYAKDNWPLVYRRIPESFANGQPLPR